MIPIVIKIGDAKSFTRPSQWTVTPDDRQTKIEIIDGVHVQDYGVVDDGETITFTAVFDKTNAALIRQYWVTRTLVPVIDHGNENLGLRRVVVKSWTKNERFPKMYIITLELWAV